MLGLWWLELADGSSIGRAPGGDAGLIERMVVNWTAAVFVLLILIGGPAQAQTVDEPSAKAPQPALSAPALILNGVPVTVTVSDLDGVDAGDGDWRLEGGAETVTARGDGPSLTFEKVIIRDGSAELTLYTPNGQAAAVTNVTTVPGWLSVLPALIAIICVVLVRQVVPALFIGIWCGAALAYGLAPHGVWSGFLDVFPVYVLKALGDTDRVSILVFSVTIGGMIGILTHNGSMFAIAETIARFAKSPRGGQAATSSLGLVIFFDDYANTLVVGNTMRPITDHLRISREKLAFIVDSTAAPVATIAIITTWIGFMVSVIDEGARNIEGWTASAYSVFLDSLPYGFYPLVAIGLVWLVALSGRDFGPMLQAERRARADGVSDGVGQSASDLSGESEPNGALAAKQAPGWAGVIPLCVLVFGTLAGIITTGLEASPDARGLRDIFGAGNSFTAMMWASLGAAVTAAMLSLVTGSQRLGGAMDSWLVGARSMMLPVVVLTLAWSLATVNDTIQTDEYLITLLGNSLPPALLPAAVFLLSAGMAFTTGTSWGVMGIMTPLVLPLAWTVTAGEPAGAAIFSAAVASVLGGAVWGDHCSPISDTTVMSSIAAGCDHAEHVRTQLPYAMLTGVACVLFGLLPIGWGVPWWMGLLAAAAVTGGVFWWLSEKVDIETS